MKKRAAAPRVQVRRSGAAIEITAAEDSVIVVESCSKTPAPTRPPTRKADAATIERKLAAGMTPQKIAKLLGIPVDEVNARFSL
jgi:hypothetical protein